MGEPLVLGQPLKTSSRDETFLGFDYGDKNIGVAVGQRVTCTATGLETIRVSSNEAKWAAISRLVQTWRPTAFVVGLSYQLDGSENPITRPILRFCRQLEGRYQLPVYTIDEMLSTVESKNVFYEHRSRRSTGFGEVKDIIAAQLILQSWLRHIEQQDQHHG
ncbi:MAG TPA: Holliday junction resolvase RuvX [Methylococcaceae bacterium]|jgi:putative Holliday junction resolvase|nr:Holliday junction resolvase RuvX [Methylococcaceae bacterium]